MPNKKHGGKRTGAGRKSAFLPLHAKKLRSTDKEWEEFLSYLTGDATVDFEILLQALIDGDGTANHELEGYHANYRLHKTSRCKNIGSGSHFKQSKSGSCNYENSQKRAGWFSLFR